MSAHDTKTGGTARTFPTTLWSEVLAAGNPAHHRHHERLAALLQAYWKPVFVYVRAAWRKPVEDAKDLTQSFFAHLLEKGTLARLRPERGSFRAYLRLALQHFLVDADRAAAARSPKTPLVSIEASPSDLERLGPQSPQESPETAYDRQWFHDLLEEATESLRESLVREKKPVYYDVFRAYALDSAAPSYQEVAKGLGLTESNVRNYLSHCRRRLREVLASRIREYADSERDVWDELDAIVK